MARGVAARMLSLAGSPGGSPFLMIAYSRRQDSNNSYRRCLVSRVSPALRDRRIDKKNITELELSTSQRWQVYTAAGVSDHDESRLNSVRTENGSRGL